MYIWFDKQGIPIELLTDIPARTGNNSVNTIYAYFDMPDADINYVYLKMEYSDGTTSNDIPMPSSSFVFSSKNISLQDSQDTRKFVNGNLYSGYSVKLTDEQLSISGATKMTIYAMSAANDDDATRLAMGTFTFNIEKSVIASNISDQTQLDLLEEYVATLPFPNLQIIEGNPDDIGTVGITGKIVINKNTWELFEYDGQKWNSLGIIKGTKGDTGAQGPQGEKGDTGRSIWKTNSKELESNSTYSFSDLSLPEGETPRVGDMVLGANKKIYLIVQIDNSKQTFVTDKLYYELLKGDPGTIPTFFIDDKGHLQVQQSENPQFSLGDNGHLIAHYD